MNLVSVLAAYGVLTAIFHIGRGNHVIGLSHTIPIVSYVPLMLFAILFGLSMDYEVFLVTQIKEHYDETKDNLGSVVDGLANTGKIITSAALIMFCVFAAFVASGDPTVKQFGVGLATAILIDATIVRCLLVPSLMILMGERELVAARLARSGAPEGEYRGRGVFQGAPRRACSAAARRTGAAVLESKPLAPRRLAGCPEREPTLRRLGQCSGMSPERISVRALTYSRGGTARRQGRDCHGRWQRYRRGYGAADGTRRGLGSPRRSRSSGGRAGCERARGRR